ncbi:MAG: Hpt domain-containing protein [Alphaproteobacteria bacterium]|nr:Hpt domain-containing protein [Alphaproteobacteria bacterium]
MSINTDSIREACEIFGKKTAYFLGLTLRDADNFMAEIGAALVNNDAQSAGLAAHSLKSIMHQAGAMEVGDCGEALQDAGEVGNLEECIDLYTQLRPLYQESKAFMEALILKCEEESKSA